MFEIKNNRIIIAGISIGLPNGLYLTTPPVLKNDKMLVFCDKDKTFYIELQADEYNNSLENDLKAKMQLSSFVIKSDIKNVDGNGLNGCYVIYDDFKLEYFELFLQRKNNNTNKYLRILKAAYRNTTEIQSVMTLASVKMFLSNINEH